MCSCRKSDSGSPSARGEALHIDRTSSHRLLVCSNKRRSLGHTLPCPLPRDYTRMTRSVPARSLDFRNSLPRKTHTVVQCSHSCTSNRPACPSEHDTPVQSSFVSRGRGKRRNHFRSWDHRRNPPNRCYSHSPRYFHGTAVKTGLSIYTLTSHVPPTHLAMSCFYIAHLTPSIAAAFLGRPEESFQRVLDRLIVVPVITVGRILTRISGVTLGTYTFLDSDRRMVLGSRQIYACVHGHFRQHQFREIWPSGAPHKDMTDVH